MFRTADLSDAILADQPLTGGLEPVLGFSTAHPTILGFLTRRAQPADAQSSTSRTADDAVHRPDKTEAPRPHQAAPSWFNKASRFRSLFARSCTQEPVQLLDSDADNKVADADGALQELGGDPFLYGYLTTTVTVFDEDRMRVEERSARWSAS